MRLAGVASYRDAHCWAGKGKQKAVHNNGAGVLSWDIIVLCISFGDEYHFANLLWIGVAMG